MHGSRSVHYIVMLTMHLGTKVQRNQLYGSKVPRGFGNTANDPIRHLVGESPCDWPEKMRVEAVAPHSGEAKDMCTHLCPSAVEDKFVQRRGDANDDNSFHSRF